MVIVLILGKFAKEKAEIEKAEIALSLVIENF